MPDDASEDESSQFAAASLWADRFDASLRSESARAKVILSACYLDELLRQLIALALAPAEVRDDPLLDGPQAPLGTFSAKIDLCVRMALIPVETGKSLHLVRRIRNRFAHDLASCDFSDSKILGWSVDLHNLNDHATPERRSSFTEGALGDFEKSVSWLVFWLKHLVDSTPSSCPKCGTEMAHRAKIKALKPGDGT